MCGEAIQQQVDDNSYKSPPSGTAVGGQGDPTQERERAYIAYN